MNLKNLESDSLLIDRVIKILIDKMPGLRKDGRIPNYYHSIAVGMALHTLGERINVVLAGYCHDLIEDAGITAEAICEWFNEEVRDIVVACSHDNDLHKIDRIKSNDDLFERAEAYGRDAIIVKVADASHNIQTIQALGKSRQLEFLERAKRWHKAGEHFLGSAHPLVAQLGRRIERASMMIVS